MTLLTFPQLDQITCWESSATGQDGHGSGGAWRPRATAQLSRDLQVRAIFVASASGLTARRVSSGRPAAPIIAVSPDLRSVRRMCLLWGVVPSETTPEALQQADALARQRVTALGLADPGQRILQISGFRDEEELSSPTIGVLMV